MPTGTSCGRYAVANEGVNSIQAQQIAALQGMGKEIAPREEGETPSLAKRQTGFDRALQYAEAALVKGPKVQLGTGEGGAGVGIIVDNNPQAAARPGTGATEGAAVAAPAQAAVAGLKRRDLAASQKVKVTTMYVRSGVPPCEFLRFLSHIF